ncbi:MAG: type I-E CRISPR-associated protein Cas7/Cse4/CasC [Gammaproteobacteria bacterium]|nr:type I-E CRISPR-associated protein Cas7/Cse4/CasC [Gammaproteobacteria bacterium]
MSHFIQLHLLTSYPPANLNRDDLGRPKTAVVGGAQRLRVSSQSLKRAWRTSDIFESALKGHVGTRTKEIGVQVFNQLRQKGVAEKKADDWAKSVAAVFGKLKKDSQEIEQLAHFSPDELRLIDELVNTMASRGEGPTEDELKLLRKQHTAADIALFGRMLASSPAYNMEAAAQVAHAITVHKVAVEDDFFTAVDDLNKGEEDMGAGHMGETEFAAGLFYQYVCVDRDLLTENLSGNKELADKTIGALIEAAASVAPTGKQNSFASRARASYIICEAGGQQPRSLSVAFLKPVQSQDILEESVSRISDCITKMDNAYGKCADLRSVMNISTGEGSLQSIIATATE